MTTQTTNKPTSHAFFVEGEGDKANWIKLGAVWNHKDGKGQTVQLDVLPVQFDGKIILREPKD